MARRSQYIVVAFIYLAYQRGLGSLPDLVMKGLLNLVRMKGHGLAKFKFGLLYSSTTFSTTASLDAYLNCTSQNSMSPFSLHSTFASEGESSFAA